MGADLPPRSSRSSSAATASTTGAATSSAKRVSSRWRSTAVDKAADGEVNGCRRIPGDTVVEFAEVIIENRRCMTIVSS